MIYDYDDPNICYAIGDCFSVYMGTGTTDRQPASGVFEQLSSHVKVPLTDTVDVYDGTNTAAIVKAAAQTNGTQATTSTMTFSLNNMALHFGNTVYIRKIGTTDIHHISGVQVDT